MKFVPLLVLVSICAYGFESNSTRIEKLETEVGSMRTRITPSASPKVDGHGVKVGLDLLYWMPRIEGTAYAYTNNRNSTGLPIDGTTLDVKVAA